MKFLMKFAAIMIVFILPGVAFAAGVDREPLDLTGNWVCLFSLVIFALAYLLVMAEEFTHLRKSKPVILAAGMIWAAIGWVYANEGLPHMAEQAVRHNLLEYAELMLFLLVAMTYINAMEERRVFDALRGWLIARGFGFRSLFWITGILAFFISPVADNLTTALLMCAVVLAVGGDNSRFVTLACINIVVAANAGGAFSPFGDITTLMVWQKGNLQFAQFFALIVPSIVNWLVTAVILSFALPSGNPEPVKEEAVLQHGAWMVVGLFI
ncbi:MAG: sodium:proton antiporter NhaD, partial [Gammaproteobacteria bacterium]